MVRMNNENPDAIQDLMPALLVLLTGLGLATFGVLLVFTTNFSGLSWMLLPGAVLAMIGTAMILLRA